MNVAPSVVTTYYPAVRVFTYNTTGLDGADVDNARQSQSRRVRRNDNQVIFDSRPSEDEGDDNGEIDVEVEDRFDDLYESDDLPHSKCVCLNSPSSRSCRPVHVPHT